MLALIDGDVIAHKACKSRHSKKAPPGMGYTEIIEMVQDRKNHVFSKEEDRIYLEDSWKNFCRMTEEILEVTFAEDFMMAVKSPLNFRDAMYPLELNAEKTKATWGYKANRWKPEGQSNTFVPVLRKLAIHEMDAIEAVHREADDLLRIWAEQAALAGESYVIVSVDKDLDCIPGKHYHIHDKRFYDVSHKEATRFFYQQLLSGDTTDNIPGIPGIGPVKAEKFLYNLHEEEELQEVVVEMYMDAYDDAWFDMLMSNGKMLYLQKFDGDFFTARGWPVVESFIQDDIVAKRKKPTISLPASEVPKVEVPKVEALKSPLIKPPSPSLKPTANVVSSPTTGFKIPPLKKG